MRNFSSFSFQKCCYWAAFIWGQAAFALIVPRTEIQAQIQIWYQQAQFHSKVNAVSRSNSRITCFCYKYLCTIINPSGRTLGMHYQLFMYSLPQEYRAFYSLGWDVGSYSEVKPVRKFLTKFCWIITICQAWNTLLNTSWGLRKGHWPSPGCPQSTEPGWGSCWGLSSSHWHHLWSCQWHRGAAEPRGPSLQGMLKTYGPRTDSMFKASKETKQNKSNEISANWKACFSSQLYSRVIVNK